MTWSGGPRDPIFQRSHVERPKAPRWRGVWRIFPCLVLLCLIAGVGQAQSSDDAAGVVPQGVVVKTVLSIVPESGSSVSQGGSYESSGLSDALLWKHRFRDAVTAIDMPADGSSVAVGTTGGEVVLLDSTGNVLWTHQSGTPIAGLGITVDGSAIVAGTGNWTVLLDGSGGVLWTMDAGGRVLEPTYPRRENTASPGPLKGTLSSPTVRAISSGRCSQEALSPPLQSILRVYSLF